MKRLPASVVLLALLGSVSCGSGGDSGRAIVGGGEIASGFAVRFDQPGSDKKRIRLTPTEDGFLAENGPNAIFWRAADVAAGRYSLSVVVQHLSSHGHPHGAGLIFGGSKLAAKEQAYTYFLVRDDGQFLIKTRKGEQTDPVTPWTAHEAVKGDAKGVAKNKIAVQVGDKATLFLVNGTEVHRVDNARIHTDGVFGFRLVHDLKVQFTGLRHQSQSAHPVAVDLGKVGKYSKLTKSGGGHFYDDVLEYRVWIDSAKGDTYQAFATFEQAERFSKQTEHAEQPLVLVLQREHINEPEPGRYVHVKGDRTTEWQVPWLAGSKRGPDSIAGFLRKKAAEAGKRPR